MKRLRIFGMIFLFVGLTSSSFTQSKTTSNFYVFTGDPNVMSQVMDYSYYISTPYACEDIDGSLCGIYLSSYQTYGQHANPNDIQQYIYSLFYSTQFEVAMDPHIKMHF